MANTHSSNESANVFHGGMRGLIVGAIVGALASLLLTTSDFLGHTGTFWFFGIAFGGGIGFFIGALASRRNHQQLAYAYDGPERRASMAQYHGVDRRVHR